MDTIVKALIFGGHAKVAALKTTDLVNRAIEIHGLSPVAAAALGKTLTVAAYMSNELKGAREKLSINIKCDGELEGIVVAADQGGKVRGYVLNPSLNIPRLGNGKQNTMQAIGSGKITVIKDLGLKDCYTGISEIVNGSLDADFAWYFTSSEGTHTALALSVVIDESGRCVSAGGIIVQPMPGCPEHILTVLEDIVPNFADIDSLLQKHGAKMLIDNYFGHFEIEYFEAVRPEYRCKCSREFMQSVVLGLGRGECVNILMERGSIEIECHFCNTKYEFGKEEVISLWQRHDEAGKAARGADETGRGN